MRPHLIKIGDYLMEEKPFASGGFSEVYKAFYDDKEKKLVCQRVIKVLKTEKNNDKKALELLETEIYILKTCKNKNVVKLYEDFMHEAKHFLVLKYCDGRFSIDEPETNPQTLRHYLNFVKSQNKIMSEAEIIKILKQLLNGFKGLHILGAMHRDFKPENVLFHKGRVKIADLGLAKISDIASTKGGTSYYTAPEISESKGKAFYTNRVDIYSLGVTLYEMAYGEGDPNVPFMDFNRNMINRSNELKDLIGKMLRKDPIQRISWREIYEHDFLKSTNLVENDIFSIREIHSNKTVEIVTEEKNSRVIFEENKQYYINKDNEKLAVEDPLAILINQAKLLPKIEEVASFAELSVFTVENMLDKLDRQSRDLLILYRRYMFELNKLWHLGCLLNESINYFEKSINIHFTLLWAKSIRIMAHELLKKMETRQNIFEDKIFFSFCKTKDYSKLKEMFSLENNIIDDQFNYLKKESQNYITEKNSLKKEIEKNWDISYELEETLMNTIIFDYDEKIKNCMEKIPKFPEYQKTYLVHLDMVFKGYNLQENFIFDERKEFGFDFEGYIARIQGESESKLRKDIEDNFKKMFHK